MKKIAVILAFLLILPGAAFGLEMMNDNAMDEVTGQAGVGIVFDDIEMFINIDKMAWLDTGGFGSTAFYGADATNSTNGGGAIAIENLQMDTLRINAITSATSDSVNGTIALGSPDASKIDLQYTYATSETYFTSGNDAFGSVQAGLNNYAHTNTFSTIDMSGFATSLGGGEATGGEYFQAKALTIDATNALPVTSEAMSDNSGLPVTVGGVLIGLPTMEMNIPEMVFTPTFYALGDATSIGACFNDGADFGTIYIEGITVSVLNGWMEISPLNH